MYWGVVKLKVLRLPFNVFINLHIKRCVKVVPELSQTVLSLVFIY